MNRRKRSILFGWEKMVKKPYNDFPEETAEAAAEFVMTHRYMPSAAVRSLLQAVKN